MELSQIVQESVESAYVELEANSNLDGNLSHEDDVLKFVQRLVLTSQISLLEAGLERKKGMIKEKEEGYTCMCEYGGACTNCLVKNYNMAIQEDIDYLQDQIIKCKELMK